MIRTRLSIRGLLNRAIYASRSGLWFPDFDIFVPKRQNVLAVLGRPHGRLIIPASNIVTDAGDVHYAQRMAAEAPTNAFTTHEMCSAGTPGKAADRDDFTPIASSQKAQTSGYPKTDDDDVDNTGAGVDIRTSRADYATGDFNHAAISHGIITNAGAGAGAPILTGYAFAAPFEKTASDTLKVIVNHEALGV